MVAAELKGLNDKIRGLLADGQWHAFSEFLQFQSEISPELASRRYITSLGKSKRERFAATKDLDAQISWGRYRIVRRRLYELSYGKVIEIQGHGDEMRVRSLTIEDLRSFFLKALDANPGSAAVKELAGEMHKHGKVAIISGHFLYICVAGALVKIPLMGDRVTTVDIG